MKQQSLVLPLVYGFALHAYIVGQPFRLRHLRRALAHIAEDAARHSDVVWLTHPGKIARHFVSLPENVVVPH